MDAVCMLNKVHGSQRGCSFFGLGFFLLGLSVSKFISTSTIFASPKSWLQACTRAFEGISV